MSNENIILKIQKLLELGNSESEHEAKQATNKAYKLLAKHNLSLQELKDVTKEYIKEDLDCKHFRTPTEYSYVLDILRNNFFVVPIFTTEWFPSKTKYKSLKSYKLFGTPSNIKIAIYVFVYLVRTYKNLYSNIKTRSVQSTLWKNKSINKNSYYMGLTKSINANLKDAKEEIENEAGLIIVEDKVLKDFKDSLKRGSKHKININTDSYNQGLIDGAKVQIKKAVNTERKEYSKGENLLTKK